MVVSMMVFEPVPWGMLQVTHSILVKILVLLAMQVQLPLMIKMLQIVFVLWQTMDHRKNMYSNTRAKTVVLMRFKLLFLT